MVISQDGAVIFVIHSGILVRENLSKLSNVNKQEQNESLVRDNATMKKTT